MLHIVKKLDFHFKCGPGGTALNAGNSAQIGDDSNYVVFDGDKWTNEIRLDEQSIAEIAGIELIQPAGTAAVRDKFEYIRLRIDGEEYKHVNFNEHMCPAFNAANPNNGPFFGGRVKVGDSYVDLPDSLCHNIGVPMLLGGEYTDAVPKVGPGDSINVEVRAPREAEGGADIVNDFVIRLSVVECRTIEMFEKLGAMYGWMSGGNVEQKFTLMDLEENGELGPYDVTKTVEMKNSTGALCMDYWTALYGGLDARKPYIYPYIRYANNAVDSVTNEEYIYTKVGSKVLSDAQELDWNFDNRKAIKLERIGTTPHDNQKYTRVYVQGRDSNPYAWTPNDQNNEYPMPVGLEYDDINYHGPSNVGRGIVIWNTKGHVSVKDNGTLIPAWATGVRGSTVSIWGKKYEF